MIRRAAPLLALVLFLIALVASATAVQRPVAPCGIDVRHKEPRTMLSDILFIAPVLASETTRVDTAGKYQN